MEHESADTSKEVREIQLFVDGVKESLEDLLHRVLKTYKQPTIVWSTFLGFFTKRGRLRESEKLNLQPNKRAGNMGGLDDVS